MSRFTFSAKPRDSWIPVFWKWVKAAKSSSVIWSFHKTSQTWGDWVSGSDRGVDAVRNESKLKQEVGIPQYLLWSTIAAIGSLSNALLNDCQLVSSKSLFTLLYFESILKIITVFFRAGRMLFHHRFDSS